MTTLQDITTDIADKIDDTTGEYTSQIQDAVRKAQRYCERETFYFNETRDVTFNTVAAQDWYGEADNSNIPTLVRIQAAFCDDIELTRRTATELEAMVADGEPSGKPTDYAYFDQQIRLYPVPSDARTVRLQLGPYRLTELSTSDSTNAWMDEAYDLIHARALYYLWRDVLKDNTETVKYNLVYREEKASLDGETTARKGSGYVRPTEF